MQFVKLTRKQQPPKEGANVAYLRVDHWNDFSFITMFRLSVFDNMGTFHDIGNVRIGFKGQETSVHTHTTIKDSFKTLGPKYFSLGCGLEYYTNLRGLTEEQRGAILSGLMDIVGNDSLLEQAKTEEVFRHSILRDISLATVGGQFRRVLLGFPPLTDFEFQYLSPDDENYGGVRLTFKVIAGSTPSTNIHAIIGRNGVGKTTLLNGMISAVLSPKTSVGVLQEKNLGSYSTIESSYFSSLVSIAFSAFDPFEPPVDQPDPSKGACYFYIGLKLGESPGLKDLPRLRQEFLTSLSDCIADPGRRRRWEHAIKALESDNNFAEMSLLTLLDLSGRHLKAAALELITKMSSGHAIVLLSLTKLVARVEEKTLVLIDEPEAHLHLRFPHESCRSINNLHAS